MMYLCSTIIHKLLENALSIQVHFRTLPVLLNLFWRQVSSIKNYGCDKVRIRIRQRSNFKRFQQIQNLTNVLSALLSNANSRKNHCSTTAFIRYA